MYYDYEGSTEECEALSESKYVLAKYRIQVVEKEPDVVFVQPKAGIGYSEEHIHEGPIALTPNLEGGDIGWNKDSIRQCLWCFCTPCYIMNLFYIKCCERCYDKCSKYVTDKEEVSTMRLCTLNICKL